MVALVTHRVMTMMGAITNCVGVLDDVLNGMASVSGWGGELVCSFLMSVLN